MKDTPTLGSPHQPYVQSHTYGSRPVTNEARNLEAFLLERGWAKHLTESLIIRIHTLGWGHMTVDGDTDNPVEIIIKYAQPVILHCNEGDFDLGGKVITRIVKDVKLSDG